MSQSSIEFESGDPTEADVPLAERPLVAGDQNTVVSSQTDSGLQSDPNQPLTATAQEIRDRLFAPPEDDFHPEAGLLIGHFEIEERIGTGGMGAVFRAIDLELSRYVALKVLHPSISSDPALIARFRNEARACAQLNHDNLARVFFSGEHDGVHYIVYEYADGQNLKDLITTRGPLPAEEAINYAIQATLALNHLDASGIVHRDIKPSNIIVTRTGRIKVVDLGLARRNTRDSVGDLTVAGAMLGTFDYIAPEQARDPRTVDIRSDIYSLGCTVYHMLTGQPPYPEGTAMQKLLDHQGKSPPNPRDLNPAVPPELAVIVQKMMQTSPDDRYRDAGQLLADLLALAARFGLKSVPAEGIVWRRMSVTRVRELSGALFLTGAVLALCITALVMHFTGTSQPADDGIAAVVPGFSRSNTADNRSAISGDESTTDVAAAENGATGERQGTPEVPVPVPLVSPFRVMRDDATVAEHDSLSAALNDARTGDEIILDFDGSLPAPTAPLFRLGSSVVSELTLRAAPGRNPVIDFAAEDEAGRTEQNQMLYLSNRLNLSVIGIHLRIHVPANGADAWALFHCVGPNRLRLKDCTVELQNAARRDAAVVRISDHVSQTDSLLPAAISLENVMVRGTCDVISVAGWLPADIRIEQSAFAVDGALIRNLGGTRDPAHILKTGLRIDAELSHVTTVSLRPAIVLRDSDGLTGGQQERDLLPLHVSAEQCVFAAATPNGTFVQSQGNAYLSEMQKLLVWNGRQNLYYGFVAYWDLDSSGIEEDYRIETFDSWSTYWQGTTDGSVAASAEIRQPPWQTSRLSSFSDVGAADLTQLQREDFELNRSLFDDPEVTEYELDTFRTLPGVSPRDLPGFPAPTSFPVSSPASEFPGSAGNSVEGAPAASAPAPPQQ